MNFNFINVLLRIGPQSLKSCSLSLVLNSYLGQLQITAFKLFQTKLVLKKMNLFFDVVFEIHIICLGAVIWMCLRSDFNSKESEFLLALKLKKF